MIPISGFRRVYQIRYTSPDGHHRSIWVETPFNDSSPLFHIVQVMKENYVDVELVKKEEPHD